ncbi:hypothetical protein N9R90_00685 [Flavobacteriaceae bacterium]|nr:hypothetical protein [Flavobacteriaceae bacterium]
MKFFKNNLIKFSVVFSILMFFGNTPLYALNSNKKINSNKDYIQLKNGNIIQGEIVKIGSNSFKILTDDGKVKIKNNEVVIAGFNQELLPVEKYRLGVLDGKRYAQNQNGNLALGILTGPLGVIIVYLTSEQMPALDAINGANKAIVDDMDYVRGYEKGARQKSGGKALLGTAIAAAAAIIIGLILADTAEDIVDDFYENF